MGTDRPGVLFLRQRLEHTRHNYTSLNRILVANCWVTRYHLQAAAAHLDEKALKVSSRSTHSGWAAQLFAGMERPKLFLVGGWGSEEFDFVQVIATICRVNATSS